MTGDNKGNGPFIEIQDVSKYFGDFAAVDSVSLAIQKGELFSILGGSGCGKTTLLRMLAGFETPTKGRIFIDGVDVTEQPPYERPVNMMFQSYAIFPHMTVEKNVAYGLEKDRVARDEITRRVDDILKLVQLETFAKRKPDQLSGGQRQRVALARALVKRPKVLLLDEPLAALDKKLREHTQFELMSIQDKLGITFVVVTHDQEEAMILSSRIAVMDRGRFMQVGTPKEVYEYPTSRFVADFIGTINMFEGTIVDIDGERVRINCEETASDLSALSEDPPKRGSTVCVAVRPEKIFISQNEPENTEDIRLSGIVEDLGYFGNLSLYRIRLPGGKIVQVSAQNRRRSAERFLEWNDEVFISWRPRSSVILVD
ncbi:MAG: ABC transporter ATP-binding protein [Gammaproteobacteria bacterium]|nr:ABC transporter ATP-binding protein [Gammaproteobacteria bacterium]